MATTASKGAQDFVKSLGLLAAHFGTTGKVSTNLNQQITKTLTLQQKANKQITSFVQGLQQATAAAGAAALAHTAMPEAFNTLGQAFNYVVQRLGSQFVPMILEFAAHLLTFGDMILQNAGTMKMWWDVATTVIGIFRSLARSALMLVEVFTNSVSAITSMVSNMTGLSALMRATGMRGKEWDPMQNTKDMSARQSEFFDQITGMGSGKKKYDDALDNNRDGVKKSLQDQRGAPGGFSAVGDMWKKMQEVVNQSFMEAKQEKQFQDMFGLVNQIFGAVRDGNRGPAGAFN